MFSVEGVRESCDLIPATSSVGVPHCMIQKQWPKKAQNSQFCFTISEMMSQEEQSLIVEGQRVCTICPSFTQAKGNEWSFLFSNINNLISLLMAQEN